MSILSTSHNDDVATDDDDDGGDITVAKVVVPYCSELEDGTTDTQKGLLTGSRTLTFRLSGDSEHDDMFTISESFECEQEQGTAVWMLSIAMASWVFCQQPRWLACPPQVVVELGSGCGLTGLAASQYCCASSVFLTDFCEKTLANLRQTVLLQGARVPSCSQLYVQKLDWNDPTACSALPQGCAQLVLGSEVIFSGMSGAVDLFDDPQEIQLWECTANVAETIAHILARPAGEAHIFNCTRDQADLDMFFARAHELGLITRTRELQLVLPLKQRSKNEQCIFGEEANILDKRHITLTWAPTAE